MENQVLKNRKRQKKTGLKIGNDKKTGKEDHPWVEKGLRAQSENTHPSHSS